MKLNLFTAYGSLFMAMKVESKRNAGRPTWYSTFFKLYASRILHSKARSRTAHIVSPLTQNIFFCKEKKKDFLAEYVQVVFLSY
jgi:hypothetical protein